MLLRKRKSRLKAGIALGLACSLIWLAGAPAGYAASPETAQEQSIAEPVSQPEPELKAQLPVVKMKKAKASFKKTITVTWEPVKKADGYIVYRKSGAGTYKKIAVVKGAKKTSYTNKKVALYKKYSYKVAAYVKKGGTKVIGEMSDKCVSAEADIYLGKKGMLWPCPSYKYISSRFGRRSSPTRGATSNHKGVDLSADKGSAILSVASGKVAEAQYSSSMGYYVKVSHGDGLYTLYEHASKLLVMRGEKVKAGQKIAKVGRTGLATGNHLHFGVLYKGIYRNPLNYLAR